MRFELDFRSASGPWDSRWPVQDSPGAPDFPRGVSSRGLPRLLHLLLDLLELVDLHDARGQARAVVADRRQEEHERAAVALLDQVHLAPEPV